MLRTQYNKNNSTSNNSSSTSLKNSVDNYKTRLKSVGVDTDVKDDRNSLEKLLNLRQDQGLIFDLLEIINRPQQALFGAIDSAQNGESALEGAWEGLKGDKETSGKELLVNAGAKDSDFELFDTSTWSDLKGSDVGGALLDLFADPMDLALFVASGGTSAVAEAGVDAAKTASKAANTVSDATKAFKYSKIDDLLGLSSQGKHLASANELLGGKVADVLKKSTKLTDKGITKGLEFLDNKNLNKAKKFATENNTTLEEALNYLGKGISKADNYANAKKVMSGILDSSKQAGGLVGKAREIDNLNDLQNIYAQKESTQLVNSLKELAKKSYNDLVDRPSNLDEYISKFVEENLGTLTNAVEHTADWTYRGSDLVNEFLQDSSRIAPAYSKKQASQMQKLLKDYGIDSEIVSKSDGLYVKLKNSINDVLDIKDKIKDVSLGKKGTEETFEKLEKAYNYYNSTPELQNIFNNAQSLTNKQTSLSDKLTGLNTSDLATNDYVRHNLNEDAARDSSKVYNSRKYDAPIAEVNARKQLGVETDLKSAQKTKTRKESQIYKTTDEGQLILKEGKPIRDDTLYNYKVASKKQAIDKNKKELASKKELLNAKKNGIDNVDISKLTKSDKSNYEVIKAQKELKDTIDTLENIDLDKISIENSNVIDNATKAYHNYFKEVTKYNNALKKKNISEDEIKAIKESVTKAKRKNTLELSKLKKYAEDTPRKLVEDANKTIDKVFEKGKNVQKARQKLAETSQEIDTIYASASDIVDSLKGKIKRQEQNLLNFEKVKDDIFNKNVKDIEKLEESINILSEEASKEFFVNSFDANFLDFAKNNALYSAGAKKFNEALTTGILNNPDYIKYTDDLVDGKVPFNFVKVNGTSAAKQLGRYTNILPDDSSALSFIKQIDGQTIYMDKDVAKVLKLANNANNNQVGPFLKMLDSLNNTMKKFSTFTLGNQFRNITGNASNMILSGMPASQIPEYYLKAGNLWNKTDDLFEKFTKGTLSDIEKKEWSILEDFYKGGFTQGYTKTQGMEKIAQDVKNKSGILNKATQASLEFNNYMDQYNRLALLMYATDHPEYVKGLGKSSALDTVREVLFDPSNMSETEQKYLKRIIPFYTFTKQNLMFQADNLLKNTGRYSKLYRSFNNIYDSLGEDSYFDYQKSNMQIPIPGAEDSNGNQLFLKTNLPFAELEELFADPGSKILGSLTPLIKTPVEIRTGKSLYTGEDLYYNTISDGLSNLGITNNKVSSVADGVEAILNNLGLQNISTNLYKKIASIVQGLNGEEDAQKVWAEILRSITQSTNSENVINSGLYEELEEYQALIKQLKNQGIDVPTIREITASNNIQLNKLKNKRANSK